MKDVEKTVRRSRKFVVLIFVATVSAYFLWFYFIQKQGLSADASVWGAFGDFVGGILNPLIAYSAFYWLTVSVLIQKQELSDTKQALVQSSLAQKEQVEFSKIAAKVDVLKLRLSKVNMQLGAHIDYRNHLLSNGLQNSNITLVFNLDGNTVNPKREFASCNERIEALAKQQDVLIDKIQELTDKQDI
ncbi:TPA: hypothetical protein I7734_22175 [Vibrio vulnificus]|nr:hypothetical protein [Vibrio vulnificus]